MWYVFFFLPFLSFPASSLSCNMYLSFLQEFPIVYSPDQSLHSCHDPDWLKHVAPEAYWMELPSDDDGDLWLKDDIFLPTSGGLQLEGLRKTRGYIYLDIVYFGNHYCGTYLSINFYQCFDNSTHTYA